MEWAQTRRGLGEEAGLGEGRGSARGGAQRGYGHAQFCPPLGPQDARVRNVSRHGFRILPEAWPRPQAQGRPPSRILRPTSRVLRVPSP